MATLKAIKKMLKENNISVLDIKWKKLNTGQLGKLIKWEIEEDIKKIKKLKKLGDKWEKEHLGGKQ